MGAEWICLRMGRGWGRAGEFRNSGALGVLLRCLGVGAGVGCGRAWDVHGGRSGRCGLGGECVLRLLVRGISWFGRGVRRVWCFLVGRTGAFLRDDGVRVCYGRRGRPAGSRDGQRWGASLSGVAWRLG